MQIRVDLGAWDHTCCGDSYEVDAIVTKDLYLPLSGSLSGDADFMESHHGLLTRGVSVTGRVVGIEVAESDCQFIPVTRLPSGAGLSDVDDDGSGDIIELATGAVLEIEPVEFIVTLDIAEGTKLPTEPAISAS